MFNFAFLQRCICPVARDIVPPSGIVEVLRGLLMSMVSNPIDALLNANYIRDSGMGRRSGICPASWQ
ncbi:hypothetical protein KCP75_17060 [Salmonella enterica subsp. enterica]|nr:hypothetical protein KCP75_17060 [Salmonella enterica subsp. enterica]